ncbi:MAG: PEP/pyruvate-binding domain-containing protein [Acidobacteriota bacterium]
MRQQDDGRERTRRVGAGPASTPDDPAISGEVVRAAVAAVAGELERAVGRPEHVATGCARLAAALRVAGMPPLGPALQLAGLLRRRVGPVAAALLPFLEEVAGGAAEPWPLLQAMLAASDPALARRALDLCVTLAASGSLLLDAPSLEGLASLAVAEGSPLGGREALARIGDLLRVGARGRERDPVLRLLHDAPSWTARVLAARILDLDGKPVPASRADRLLGTPDHRALRPYLEYTRAGYADVLELATGPGRFPPPLDDLRRAAASVGVPVLQRVIAELGWGRLRLGLEARPRILLRVGASFPLVLSPQEADLFGDVPAARPVEEPTLFIAHGGGGERGAVTPGGEGEVARFRGLNVVHAEILEDLLDMAPLDRNRVERIVRRMDRVVADFTALFSGRSEEASAVPAVYEALRRAIRDGLERESGGPVASDLARRVLQFEDPATPGQVTTLHGLKRYLHQRGLQLGLRLLREGRSTNRTVDLLVASPSVPFQAVRRIRYVDFEPESAEASAPPGIPYPVRIVVEAFAHQLCHGQTKFPEVSIFCYGTEVQYYVAFRNHPVFLRVNFAPPVQGGMIDVEYYGVSQYELSHHPNPRLEALMVFLRRMGFEAKVDATHVEARYDKERAGGLGELCTRARRLFSLVPYLMDLDWVIGGLDLDERSRNAVARAWSSFLDRWQVLPTERLLTGDRRGIVAGSEPGPSGAVERRWSGEGPYADRFSRAMPPGTLDPVLRRLQELEIEADAPTSDEDLCNQRDLERVALGPLRAALARGEVIAGPAGLRRQEPGRFRREAAPVIFARMLPDVDAALDAARLAEVVAPLDRFLAFRTTGSVNGYDVQTANLELRGKDLFLHVLRDGDGIVRLAFFAEDPVLFSRRDPPSGPWRCNADAAVQRLVGALRRDGYLPAASEPAAAMDRDGVVPLLEGLRRGRPPRSSGPVPEDAPVEGLRAAPGRAVGAAALGTAGRRPEELAGRVLVASSVGPRDAAHLYRSCAVVSTGGGILSHAGLLAAQFGRPALLVAGQWSTGPAGEPLLTLRSSIYREDVSDVGGIRVVVHRSLRELRQVLREGDLLVVDALEGYLQVLGQDRATRVLHDELTAFFEASRMAEAATEHRALLALRGRQLRARHQLRKILSRLQSASLARHAIRELLLSGALPGGSSRADRADLLSILLGNPTVGPDVLGFLRRVTGDLRQRLEVLGGRTLERIPATSSVHEILQLRLELLRLVRTLEDLDDVLGDCGLGRVRPDRSEVPEVDRCCIHRLLALHADLAGRAAVAAERDPESRHLIRRLDRLEELLCLPDTACEGGQALRAGLRCRDEAARASLRGHRVLGPEAGGTELSSLVGWKAANLGEMARLLGTEIVPRWFVVTRWAFEEVLRMPPSPGASARRTLAAAIEEELARPGLTDEQRSRRIDTLWEHVPFPPGLAAEVEQAYREVIAKGAGGDGPDGGFVSVRSSSCEEDTEALARAGEFDTFLFVRGEEDVIRHLRRAWAGLWTARAIHSRAVLGLAARGEGGGIIVQRIAWARVAGVVTTVNAPEGIADELVINAGLGLGEGIVSGAVAADHIVVPRRGLEGEPVRFRYRIADKRERIAFDEKIGRGTVQTETLYHQRLRPAMDYGEVCDLARTAARLESIYGHPLDIEFAIEGNRLWLLQVRPLGIALALVRETAARFPLRPSPATARTGGAP